MSIHRNQSPWYHLQNDLNLRLLNNYGVIKRSESCSSLLHDVAGINRPYTNINKNVNGWWYTKKYKSLKKQPLEKKISDDSLIRKDFINRVYDNQFKTFTSKVKGLEDIIIIKYGLVCFMTTKDQFENLNSPTEVYISSHGNKPQWTDSSFYLPKNIEFIFYENDGLETNCQTIYSLESLNHETVRKVHGNKSGASFSIKAGKIRPYTVYHMDMLLDQKIDNPKPFTGTSSINRLRNYVLCHFEREDFQQLAKALLRTSGKPVNRIVAFPLVGSKLGEKNRILLSELLKTTNDIFRIKSVHSIFCRGGDEPLNEGKRGRLGYDSNGNVCYKEFNIDDDSEVETNDASLVNQKAWNDWRHKIHPKLNFYSGELLDIGWLHKVTCYYNWYSSHQYDQYKKKTLFDLAQKAKSKFNDVLIKDTSKQNIIGDKDLYDNLQFETSKNVFLNIDDSDSDSDFDE